MKADFSCGYDLKGKRPGTAKECFKKGQIRRYGIKALDDGYIDVLLADRQYDRKRKTKTKEPELASVAIINDYLSGGRDFKVLIKVINFMKNFDDKNNGSKLKFNKFEVKKNK